MSNIIHDSNMADNAPKYLEVIGNLLAYPNPTKIMLNYQITDNITLSGDNVISWRDKIRSVVASGTADLYPISDSDVTLMGYNTIRFHKKTGGYTPLQGTIPAGIANTTKKLTLAMLVKYNAQTPLTYGNIRANCSLSASSVPFLMGCYPAYADNTIIQLKSQSLLCSGSVNTIMDSQWHVVLFSVDYDYGTAGRFRYRFNIDGIPITPGTQTGTWNPSTQYINEIIIGKGIGSADQGLEANVAAVMVWGDVLFTDADCEALTSFLITKYGLM